MVQLIQKSNLTKAELAEIANISPAHLAKLMNVRYYQDLAAVGYEKKSKYLTPEIVRVFLSKFGKPLSPEDFID